MVFKINPQHTTECYQCGISCHNPVKKFYFCFKSEKLVIKTPLNRSCNAQSVKKKKKRNYYAAVCKKCNTVKDSSELYEI